MTVVLVEETIKGLGDIVWHVAHMVENRDPVPRNLSLALSSAAVRLRTDGADATRWKMVERALIDWRDAEDYPAEQGGGLSPSQQNAKQNMVRAVEAALRTLKLEGEAKRGATR